jgi:hypothetical protein
LQLTLFDEFLLSVAPGNSKSTEKLMRLPPDNLMSDFGIPVIRSDLSGMRRYLASDGVGKSSSRKLFVGIPGTRIQAEMCGQTHKFLNKLPCQVDELA